MQKVDLSFALDKLRCDAKFSNFALIVAARKK